MFLKILVDRFPEITVAGFVDVVAGREEENACKGDEKESTHE
jgi:hypothetical protein